MRMMIMMMRRGQDDHAHEEENGKEHREFELGSLRASNESIFKGYTSDATIAYLFQDLGDLHDRKQSLASVIINANGHIGLVTPGKYDFTHPRIAKPAQTYVETLRPYHS